MSEKLQKVLANAGIGSRREMERWIEAGRISVNGSIATLGARVETSDDIRVDGEPLRQNPAETFCRVIMYNKPEGEICSRKDPEGRTTVFERLPNIKHGRWISIGRLDINTSGLLLFTNDGELANRLMHPRHVVEREYAVRVFGDVDDAMIRRLKKGVMLEDGEAKFIDVKRRKGEDTGLNQWFSVTIAEGRNREVRRMWESQEVQVSRLMRTRYGSVELNKRLPQGAWVELELKEINQLRSTVQLPPETETKIKKEQGKLDHVRLSRMRRSIQKHKARNTKKKPAK
ncbi:23S rRNA pseudouridine(2605) synthase RluB [Planctobacterium marinum]|uniref:Pseudouridine synthase n=1 Tax=Planctobacterium marinum TaxID=1631968 RepID=A0AA48HWU2_9ALTE|nr:pseudouridine synthase [Planctobacterium marinum]